MDFPDCNVVFLFYIDLFLSSLSDKTFTGLSYMSYTVGVSEGTRTTYHSQAPRLLLLMSPSFIRVNYVSNTVDVLVGT